MFCMKCGLELPDDSRFCRKCGIAFPITAQEPSATIPLAEPQPSAALPNVLAAPAQSTWNFGTFVFAVFSTLSLLVCLAKGIVPIYFVEVLFWAALAWYWHKKNPANQLLNAGIVLLAVVVAAGQGLIIGRQLSNTQGTQAFRSGERSTDSQTSAKILADRAWALVNLGPQKLMQSCGKPLNDKRLERSNKATGFTFAVARQLTYKGTDNSVLTFTFLKRDDNGIEMLDSTWFPPSVENGEREYEPIYETDMDRLFTELPCIPAGPPISRSK